MYTQLHLIPLRYGIQIGGRHAEIIESNINYNNDTKMENETKTERNKATNDTNGQRCRCIRTRLNLATLLKIN